MRLAAAALPASTPTLNRHNVQTRSGRSFLNRIPHLTGFTRTQADVAVSVSNSHNSLKPRLFTRIRLLLNQINIYNLLLKIRKQRVNNLSLRNLQATQENLFNRRNLAFLNHLNQTRLRNPFLCTLWSSSSFIPTHAFFSPFFLNEPIMSALTLAKCSGSFSGASFRSKYFENLA